MNLSKALHTALDELRMQMLGVQVLFGFEFQALFQDRFDTSSVPRTAVHALGLVMLVVALGLLLAVPSQHRLVERGEASERLYSLAKRYANLALFPIAGALGCAVYVALALNLLGVAAAFFAGTVTVAALFAWFVVGRLLRLRNPPKGTKMEAKPLPLHEKIDQMLTEARVILPGAQALLGFQLIVMMTAAFERLPDSFRIVHFVALGCLCVCIILLIAPAALHRIAFSGEDDSRLHRLGSALITSALAPLALSISADLSLAMVILSESKRLALLCASITLCLLLGLWYAVPYAIRRTRRRAVRP